MPNIFNKSYQIKVKYDELKIYIKSYGLFYSNIEDIIEIGINIYHNINNNKSLDIGFSYYIDGRISLNLHYYTLCSTYTIPIPIYQLDKSLINMDQDYHQTNKIKFKKLTFYIIYIYLLYIIFIKLLN